MSGRRDGEEVERKEEEGEEERKRREKRSGVRGERRGGITLCEDEEGREYSHHICSHKENFIQQRGGCCTKELRTWE